MPGTSTGFQTFTNIELPVGVAGDFAGANIRASIVVGPGAFVAPPGGTLVGNMGWADPATGICSNYFKPNTFPGFVHRAGQAVITNFLGIATAQIPQGLEVTPMAQGDFWGTFAAGATVLQKVYADPVTGALSSAATGASVTASLSSGGASIAANVLTTTDADATGTIAVGQVVTSSSGIPEGTYIASSAGTGSGTHLWNLANVNASAIPNVTAGTLTWTFYGKQETPYFVASAVPANPSFTAALAAPVAPSVTSILTVSAVASGAIVPGQWLSATGLVLSQNVQILSQLTSTAAGGALGSTGTYLTSAGPAITSTATFAATQGQLGKISTWSA